MNCTPQASGTEIPENAVAGLERLWAEHIGVEADSDNADAELTAMEGANRVYLVRHRRRGRRLRDAKLAAVAVSDGGRIRCQVSGCAFDVEAGYGAIGRGFAHVHHLNPDAQPSCCFANGAQPNSERARQSVPAPLPWTMLWPKVLRRRHAAERAPRQWA